MLPAMGDPDIQREVKAFIVEAFLFGQDEANLGNDQSLLASSILDSTGILELIGFLEEKYAFKVEDDEVVPDNFESIDQITAFVRRKRA
jgi:acyl carrier protein